MGEKRNEGEIGAMKELYMLIYAAVSVYASGRVEYQGCGR